MEGFPIVLAFAGGALGTLFGFAAIYTSSRIFRSGKGVFMKYLQTGIVSLFSVIGFFVFAAVAEGLIKGL